MSEIDNFIGSISASLDALKKAASLAEDANVPEEERIILQRAQESLQAMSERMHDLAMERGLTRDVTTRRLELKDRDEP